MLAAGCTVFATRLLINFSNFSSQYPKYVFSYAKFLVQNAPNFQDELHKNFGKIEKLRSSQNNWIMKN